MNIEIFLNQEYQIGRHDSRNLVIRRWVISEKNPPGHWAVYSYHGNSLKSLVAGINELVTYQITPSDSNPLKSLEEAQLEQVKMLDRIEKQLELLLAEKK